MPDWRYIKEDFVDVCKDSLKWNRPVGFYARALVLVLAFSGAADLVQDLKAGPTFDHNGQQTRCNSEPRP